MLANGLVGSLGVSVEHVRCAVEVVGIDVSRRAEILSIEEFALLSARL
jgi:hypothetical protein